MTTDLAERFRDVDAWVFDLDNTLYPAGTSLGQQINDGIRSVVAQHFGVDIADAAQIQRALRDVHGTTLRGMMTEHGIEPETFLAFEAKMDYSVLAPDPSLARVIRALPGRRIIFTNGSRVHAERVLERVGMVGMFDDIFDILAGELIPKPMPEAYDRFVTELGVAPARAVMFEDLLVNLEIPRRLGMSTVLVGSAVAPVVDLEHQDNAYDYATDDLAGFLRRIVEVR
ncbi:pyrimidine 5'-nucleotidase [Leekyejoonella antrihumi]|uniref:Pyrimidine 5'-nucleotidase n=1 Tax=Leekyejoonella antrihumi TaxID=1660198 RepID=A0A563DVT2_9MICO|nr:pyrimidine 5'-nucleotidase [Leekyejoonella antrihumi]TWP34380.1 pyrimidine 5'-nucleotidase [Leekyejoonella antrihumi]